MQSAQQVELEARKRKEIEWADFRRGIDEKEDAENYKKFNANVKYYSINRAVNGFVEHWIKTRSVGKDIFEIACGNGGLVRIGSAVARSAVAADIAPLSIEQAKQKAKGDPGLEKIDYRAMDCENTGLPANSFDIIIESGALHHMDLDKAYAEAARLLRPDGEFLCTEAMRHNPVIHLYRRLTPHLRTAWEVDHILGRKQVLKGLEYFQDIELHCYHIATLFALPFRRTPLFNAMLAFCEKIDGVLTKIPGVKWIAWQCVFVLKRPRKPADPKERA